MPVPLSIDADYYQFQPTSLRQQKQFTELLTLMKALWAQDSFDGVSAWMQAHFQSATKFAKLVDIRCEDINNLQAYQLTEIKFDLHWSDCVSDYHHAPRGYKDRFGKYDAANPTGYPGWHGYVRYKTGATAWDSSAVMRQAGINVGTGGLYDDHWRFDCDIFAYDFPHLALAHMLKIGDTQEKIADLITTSRMTITAAEHESLYRLFGADAFSPGT